MRGAGAALVRAVREETKADAGTDEDVEKVTADRLRRAVQKTDAREKITGEQDEIEVKRKGEAIEVAVHMHLGCRP